MRLGVRRGLTIVLSAHAASDVVRWSELFPAMRALNIGSERVAEVLHGLALFPALLADPGERGNHAQPWERNDHQIQRAEHVPSWSARG